MRHRARFDRRPSLCVSRASSRRWPSRVRIDVLVLDDLLRTSMKDTERRDLLESSRTDTTARSTAITPQLPTNTWHEVLGDPMIVDAICDRLEQNAHMLSPRDPSMGRKKGLTPIQPKPPPDRSPVVASPQSALNCSGTIAQVTAEWALKSSGIRRKGARPAREVGQMTMAAPKFNCVNVCLRARRRPQPQLYVERVPSFVSNPWLTTNGEMPAPMPSRSQQSFDFGHSRKHGRGMVIGGSTVPMQWVAMARSSAC
jgi:hypothetical protein